MAIPLPSASLTGLSPGQSGRARPPSGEGLASPTPVLATHPWQAALRGRVAVAGEALIRQFVAGLDAGVQGLLAESRHASETRALLDLSQGLALHRATLERGFLAALHRRFDPLAETPRAGVFDRHTLQLLPTEEVEENLVLAQLAELADAKAGEVGRQVCARLQWLAREQGLPALQQALSAAALPQCYAQAFRHAGFGTAERLLAYRLVETQGLAEWPVLLQAVLETLDQQGFSMPRLLSATAAQEELPAVSEATWQTLRRDGPDSLLTQALLRLLNPPLGRSDAARITVLAGGWLDALLCDPELPAALRPDLEALRLVLIKVALCDPTFLIQPLHPVRQPVDELVQRATFTAVQGYSLAPLRRELTELAERISIHGQFARDALSLLPPLDSDLVAQFHRQVEKDRRARRENLLHRVRALVTREVEARTLDVSLPAAARAALARGFQPLLTTLILRHGSTGTPTREARQLLDRFVDSFALQSSASEREAVLAAFEAQLREAELAGPHLSSVCQQLQQAYAELEQEALATQGHRDDPPPAEPPQWQPVLPQAPSAATPLQIILRPGQWFRVRDYKRGDDRWLSLTGVHLDQDRLVFSGFDGATALALRASQFAEDLASGLAEPLHPSATLLQALQTLRSGASATAAASTR